MLTLILVVLLLVVLVLAWQVLDTRWRFRDHARGLERQLSDGLTRAVDERLGRATTVFGDLRERLGALTEATRHVQDVGKDIASLQQVLQPPKLRGGLGELLLERLLAQVLPPASYRVQHGFRNGQVVDAVILLGQGLVPVDSKFPLEAFRRLAAAESDEERKKRRSEFEAVVKRHIDAVAQYIRPDEGTFNFALMYIPAENVYYEAVLREPLGKEDSIHSYALKRNVMAVSPNSFYAYLQAIVLGLKGLHVERTAREIMGQLGRLRVDLERFQRDFGTLGTHLENAWKKYGEAEKKLDRLDQKLELASAGGGELEDAETPQLEKFEGEGKL